MVKITPTLTKPVIKVSSSKTDPATSSAAKAKDMKAAANREQQKLLAGGKPQAPAKPKPPR
ncbi:hypothetical protein D9619_000750 [Psilocybe cf. subviscida]|uniref:Uncharacterized protein n=1 Tax=Psilocybe cf. subviscida TaxID=2480587 RepID=A0A8H5BES9_9AGAR|nr:hypothetical protein D9619_000750 [Psilocybe cf. subviscida]